MERSYNLQVGREDCNWQDNLKQKTENTQTNLVTEVTRHNLLLIEKKCTGMKKQMKTVNYNTLIIIKLRKIKNYITLIILNSQTK